ncbi:lytic transglycosylase domain-containing protein [Breoghania sp. JC706]|uniref:lytic transglycosylase domain-containing protein n=1 Tax=Breoghania sp. JC706 TaxID=3117732 RepID=UPI00300820FE
MLTGMLAGVLLGCADEAPAAVFEQTNDGQFISMGSGAPQGAPLRSGPGQNADPAADQAPGTMEALLSGFSARIDPAGMPSSIVRQTERARTVCGAVPTDEEVAELIALVLAPDAPEGDGAAAMEGLGKGLKLPAPRAMRRTLSDRQDEMRDLAVKVARRFARSEGVLRAGLSPEGFVRLFTTMIQRESAFNPRAVSPVGARGLGQLMPRTARALGVADSFAPEENLEGAATYLTAMLERFGSPALALAAYNAGPGAVSKHGGIPPYRETRQYVADILHAVKTDAPRTRFASAAGEGRSTREQALMRLLLAARAVPVSVPTSASVSGPAAALASLDAERGAEPVKVAALADELPLYVPPPAARVVLARAPVRGPACVGKPDPVALKGVTARMADVLAGTARPVAAKRQDRLPSTPTAPTFSAHAQAADAPNTTILHRQPARGARNDATGSARRAATAPTGEPAHPRAAPPAFEALPFTERKLLVPISASGPARE